MNLRLFAVRAASSAENTPEDIAACTCELYKQLLSENKIQNENIVSLQIGVTKDITALNPASALRAHDLARDVPLFCTQEPQYEHARSGIIRFLMFFYADENFQVQHVYLRNASNLRTEMLRSADSLRQKGAAADKSTTRKTLWLVSREYAGIAEAGGLKNVVKALAENSRDAGVAVTVFLPKYRFVTLKAEKTVQLFISTDSKRYKTEFYESVHEGIHFVLVRNTFYDTKQGVYTYTDAEALTGYNPNAKKGLAYEDTDLMNLSFQLAIVAYAKTITDDKRPDIIHCHDGHTAFLPSLIENDHTAKTILKNTRFIITIHNAGDMYRQQLWHLDYAQRMTGLPIERLQSALVADGVEPFLLSAASARLTTVSPWYAAELRNTEQSPFSYRFSKALQEKNIDIIGITNGIEYANYAPQDSAVSHLPFSYNPLENDFDGKYRCRKFFTDMLKEKNTDEWSFSDELHCYGRYADQSKHGEKLLFIAYHGRVVHQKGIDVLLQLINTICPKHTNIRFLIMGQGTGDYEEQCIQATKKFSGQVLYFKGYAKEMARLVTAVSDFIVLPSLFEPCGLEDFIAQIYGTIPIAHAIGGLQKIENGITGFLCSVDSEKEKFSPEKLSHVMGKIILKLNAQFLASPYTRVLEDQKMREMIFNANKKILEVYNWKKIVTEAYFKLYGF